MSYKTFVVCSLLFLLGILPNLSVVYLGATSYGLGLVIACVVFLPFTIQYFPQAFRVPTKLVFFLLLLCFFSCVQQLSGYGYPLSLKAFVAYFAAICMLFVASLSSCAFRRLDNMVLYKAIKLLYWLMLVIALCNLIFVHNSAQIFPFGEASHFFLYFGLFSMVYFVIAKNTALEWFILCANILLSFLQPSLTSLVYAVLMGCLNLKLRARTLITAISVILVAVILFTQDSYFKERINFSNSSTNLSALVYKQGIEDTYNSLMLTKGFGLGFENMGKQPASRAAKSITMFTKVKSLNRFDGGFFASKLISEFGIFGLALVMMYLVGFFKAYFFLRHRANTESLSMKKLIYNAVFYSFFIEMFVRGVGYFSPQVFLLITLYIAEKSMNHLTKHGRCSE